MKTDFISDENMSLPFEEISEESSNEVEEVLEDVEEDEEIEVLKDPRRSAKEVIKDTANVVSDKASEIKTNIQNEDIYENNTDVPILKNKEQKKKMDKVLKAQIILVVLWVVLTVSIYFFGYELFEPIIPIN